MTFERKLETPNTETLPDNNLFLYEDYRLETISKLKKAIRLYSILLRKSYYNEFKIEIQKLIPKSSTVDDVSSEIESSGVVINISKIYNDPTEIELSQIMAELHGVFNTFQRQQNIIFHELAAIRQETTTTSMALCIEKIDQRLPKFQPYFHHLLYGQLKKAHIRYESLTTLQKDYVDLDHFQAMYARDILTSNLKVLNMILVEVGNCTIESLISYFNSILVVDMTGRTYEEALCKTLISSTKYDMKKCQEDNIVTFQESMFFIGTLSNMITLLKREFEEKIWQRYYTHGYKDPLDDFCN
jgi:arsenate reductase-like glutaredoxin family protein